MEWNAPAQVDAMSCAQARVIESLYRERPRNRFLRASLTFMGVLIVAAWVFGDFLSPDLFSAKRWGNVERFLHELRPYPLQDGAFEWMVALDWAWGILSDKGWHALVQTLAISVAAIVLAGIAGWLLAIPAARNIATAEPFLVSRGEHAGWDAALWRGLAVLTRVILIFLRAIPEYVWAFLLLALFGPTAWPVVLALALHNTGILGKLSAEVVEDLPPGPMRALRGAGATRLQISAMAIFPLALPRLLLFFFYRWETCVREATVLGMLGVVSLGYWIQDARARNFYDEMFFLVLLAAVLVIIGDIISTLVRGRVRRAS